MNTEEDRIGIFFKDHNRLIIVLIIGLLLFGFWGISHSSEISNIPLLIQGAGLALVTLLITISFSKTIAKDTRFEEIDKRILFHILNGKVPRLIIVIGLIFFPPIFWEISFLKIPIYICSGVGLYFLLERTAHLIKWICDVGESEFDERFKFLEDLDQEKAIAEVWHSIWIVKDIDYNKENRFLRIFFNRLENFPQEKKEDTYLPVALLNTYKENLSERNIFNVLNTEFFFPLLDWHFKAWEKIEKARSEGSEAYAHMTAIFILNEIISGIQELLFGKKNTPFLFSKYFKILKKHINEHKKSDLYIKEIFSIFLNNFLDKAAFHKAGRTLWRIAFPPEWEVTKSNLEGKNKIYAKSTLEIFLTWFQDRIYITKEETDASLESANYNLFPEVEPILWAKILSFVHLYDELGMRGLLIHKRTFGLRGRVYTYYESEKNGKKKIIEKRKKDIEKTFELALYLFGTFFEKKELEKYRQELKDLKNTFEEPIFEERRESLLEIFEEMLKSQQKN